MALDIAQLDELLTRPSPDLAQDVRMLKGDIMILGAGGKMGPSLARLLRRTITEHSLQHKVFAVSRFSDQRMADQMQKEGIEIIRGNLLEEGFLQQLPQASHILYLVGHKFGTAENQGLTWAMNTYLPGRVAATFPNSNIVAFSTGNIYPLVPVNGFGASEATPPGPIGEYAQSCLGRERILEYFSRKNQTPMLIYRLNYALDLRYGVLNDIAQLVIDEREIDLGMGFVNVIWQGDANEYAIRCLHQTATPPRILNITGSEKLSVRKVAETMGKLLAKTPKFVGQETETALLNDARVAHQLFGPPKVSAHQLIEWTVAWITSGGNRLKKPTHFQEREGNF